MAKNNECPYLAGCTFFNTLTLQTSAEILKTRYCRGDYGECKRHALKSSGGTVPENLWPDGRVAG